MLVRYAKNAQKKPVKQAEIYEGKECGLSPDLIDADASWITQSLTKRGYQAFIVGGAVRDLLTNKEPKDFDIATDASPSVVRRIFPNSRIIGRRFRLVHVYFGGNKIHEVATFRSTEASHGVNLYGTLAEDAKRRDFTMNALYYSPEEDLIYDYVNGVRDIERRILRCVLPHNEIFSEDPVRMVRAIKYATIVGAKIPFSVRLRLRRSSSLLARSSPARLVEELFKILSTGSAANILLSCLSLGLFSVLLPGIHAPMKEKGGKAYRGRLFSELFHLDDQVKHNAEERRSTMLARLLDTYLEKRDLYDPHLSLEQLFREVKKGLAPLPPANRELEMALRQLYKERNIAFPRLAFSSRRRRHQHAPHHRKHTSHTLARKEDGTTPPRGNGRSGRTPPAALASAQNEKAASPSSKRRKKRAPRPLEGTAQDSS